MNNYWKKEKLNIIATELMQGYYTQNIFRSKAVRLLKIVFWVISVKFNGKIASNDNYLYTGDSNDVLKETGHVTTDIFKLYLYNYFNT